MYVEMDGVPWCAVEYEIVDRLWEAGCRHTCAHASLALAEDHVAQIKRMFPLSHARVVHEPCPQPNAPSWGED